MIPAIIVALCCGLAGAAWIVFARTQKGRMQGRALIWLSVPFIGLAFIYTWFVFVDVPIEMRAGQARVGFLSISISQATILFILSYLQRGKHGTQ